MSKNLILDYEQVLDKLDLLCSKYDVIKEEEDLAVTKYGLPIKYYTVGSGNKEIVITGATHGAELVTTDFVLRLMDEMGNNKEDFKLDEYTFHIIPMLNPEGYLITSSAVRAKVPRDMDIDEAEKICKEYYIAYRKDDQEAIARRKNGEAPDRISIRHYQRMFSDVDYNCISEKYKDIRDSVKVIYDRYPDLPKGSIITWDANADGIDIQANTIHNYSAMHRAIYGMHSYGSNRYENIDCSHPGPMNCGMDVSVGFYETIETKVISNLLDRLYKKGTLVGYNNYHSTGGVIYHRPSHGGNGVKIEEDLYWQKIVNNVCLALLYRSDTYKNIKDIEGSKYNLKNGEDGSPTTTNDVFRMKYPADLLIELSGMGGNPIAPYGDIDGNYLNLINSNIDAFKGYIKSYEIVKKISDYIYKSIESIVVNHKLEDVELMNDVVKLVYEKAGDMMNEVNKLVKNNKIEDVYVKENNLSTKADSGELLAVVKKAIEANPKAVEDYKAGKKKAAGAMVGFVMKEMKGKCDPATANSMITEELDKMCN